MKLRFLNGRTYLYEEKNDEENTSSCKEIRDYCTLPRSRLRVYRGHLIVNMAQYRTEVPKFIQIPIIQGFWFRIGCSRVVSYRLVLLASV